MKRAAALLAVLLLITLTACGAKEVPEEVGSNVLHDTTDGESIHTYSKKVN